MQIVLYVARYVYRIEIADCAELKFSAELKLKWCRIEFEMGAELKSIAD